MDTWNRTSLTSLPGFSKTVRTFSALGLAMLVVVSGSCAKGGDSSAESGSTAITVQTGIVSTTTIPDFTELTGTVEGRTIVPVATKLMSQILVMGFNEGDRVSKGDVLARLDDSDITAMQLEAAAFRAEARAALGEVAAGIAQGQAAKAQAEASLAQAMASRDDALADAKRYRTLTAEGVVARVQADKYELAAEVAEENVQVAIAAVEQAEAVISQAESKTPQVEARHDQAAARGAQATALLEYAVLVSPIDGVVTSRLADPGQLTIPGQPLYMLADDSGFVVKVQAAEQLATLLTVGQPVDVLATGPTGESRTLSGTVQVINAASNPATHTVGIEVRLESDSGLVSGMFVRVLIPAGESAGLQIPAAAVVHEGELQFVWRVSSSGMLGQAPVETMPGIVGMLEVIQGLSDGDEIVTEPSPDLYPGARVNGSRSGT